MSSIFTYEHFLKGLIQKFNWKFHLIVLDDAVIEVRGRPSNFDESAKNACANGSTHSNSLHLLRHPVAGENVTAEISVVCAGLIFVSDGFLSPGRCLRVKHSCPVQQYVIVREI